LPWLEQHGDVADARDQGAAGIAHQIRQQRVACDPLDALEAQLDELVVGERAPGLAEHPGGQALVADLDDRFKRMCAAAQEA